MVAILFCSEFVEYPIGWTSIDLFSTSTSSIDQGSWKYPIYPYPIDFDITSAALSMMKPLDDNYLLFHVYDHAHHESFSPSFQHEFLFKQSNVVSKEKMLYVQPKEVQQTEIPEPKKGRMAKKKEVIKEVAEPIVKEKKLIHGQVFEIGFQLFELCEFQSSENVSVRLVIIDDTDKKTVAFTSEPSEVIYF